MNEFVLEICENGKIVSNEFDAVEEAVEAIGTAMAWKENNPQIVVTLLVSKRAAGDQDYDDWKYEVANDDTRLGFADWMDAKRAAEAEDIPPFRPYEDDVTLRPHMDVYVVSFHPAIDSGANGGFEWRYSREEALREAASMITREASNDGPEHNIVFAKIRVPFEVNPARPREYGDREPEITEYLSENTDLFELP